MIVKYISFCNLPKLPNILHFLKFNTNCLRYSSEKIGGEHIHPLYESHIPTSLFQKILLTLGSSVISISDVYRHDMIAVLGETTGVIAAKSIKNKMSLDPEGQHILEEKPRINSKTLNYDYLSSLSPNTLGHAYLKFLQKHAVTPDSRRDVTFVDDADLAYVIQRYREVHDLNHTLLGMPTNMLGEVAIKWVEAIQTGFPMCISGALLGPVRLSHKQRQKYIQHYLPWAIKCGNEAKFLMNIYYERRWDQDLQDLKQELNIQEFHSS